MESELLERIERWAVDMPTKMMLAFVDDQKKNNPVASLTCSELHYAMQTLASLLLSTPQQHTKGMGLKPGDRVLLVYPPGIEFIVAFLACLRAGIVAVPVYPPDPRKMKKDIHMFVAVAKNCGAHVALTSSDYYHVKKIMAIKQKLSFSDQNPWPEYLQWHTTDDLVKLPDTKKLWLRAEDAPSIHDIAFLQYTSGSTSTPKGVVLTHGNLNHNLRTISSALQAGKDTVVVSWLPQYHDMGLIGAYLGTIFNGGQGVYMSPFSFIRDPMFWIRMISKYHATHLQAPNFAYALCARKSDRLQTSAEVIDLSSVRHMINGAEPIQGDAIDAFYKAFAPYGLRQDVIKPTYGLAEHTVYVCGSGQQRLWVDKRALEHENRLQEVKLTGSIDRNVKEMIGCGIPSFKDHGIDVRIVDPETSKELDEGLVGEIWILSPSKAHGYYGDDMRTISKETFDATLWHDHSKQSEEAEPHTTYLRTGDLGVLYHHELFICGRRKDLVIIRGRNHYPQDLEATAEQSFPDEIRPGCTAAFAFTDGTEANDGEAEKLALVAELRDADMKQKASLCTKIRSAIAREHGVKVTLIVLLKPRTIPKTTSGKISRSRCKRALEDKKLEEVYRNEDMIGDAPDGGEDEQAEATGAMRDTAIERTVAANANRDSKLPSIITDEPPEQVLEFLKTELAQLLDTDKRSINWNTPLQQLGMDSMALTQLQGIITQKYHVHVEEEVLYNELTSLTSLHAALCGGRSAYDVSSGADPLTSLNGQGGRTKPKKLFCGCIAC